MLLYTVGKEKSTQYKQKFRKCWLKDSVLSTWLEEKSVDECSVAYCKYCCVYLNSKHGDLIAHSKTNKHSTSCKIKQSTLPLPVKPVSFNEELAKSECRCALFVSCHSAVLAADHLSSIMQHREPELKCCRTKCMAIIRNVLAPHFLDELLADIKSGPGSYSLLLDESTDNTDVKFLGVSVVYFSFRRKHLVSTFLALEHLTNGDAKSITDAVIEMLKRLKLPITKMRGIGTDNANVMTGEIGGVYALMKKHQPSLILIRCMCHSIQLAVSHASENCLPRNLEYLIDQTYNWFSRSTERQMKYKKLYVELNGAEPLKILRCCDTRWLSIAPCITRILDQWETLKAHFNEVRITAKCFNAEMLYSMYCDETNRTFLKFLQPILNDINIFNQLLQSSQPNHTKVFYKMTTLLRSWIQMVTLPNSRILKRDIYSTPIADIQKTLDPKPYLGYQFEKALQNLIDSKAVSETDAQTNIKNRCINFLLALIEEFQKRLPENVSILENIQMFSPSVCLNQSKSSIVPLLELFRIDELQATVIQKQWTDLHLIKWKTPESSNKNSDQLVELWAEIYAYVDIAQNVPFKELAEFILSILVLPHSNAEVERLFSVMNCVKSKSRNKMGNELLASILQIRFGLKLEESCCHNYAHRIPKSYLQNVGTSKIYPARKSPQTQPTASASLISDKEIEEDPDEYSDFDLEVYNDNLLFV